MVCQSEINAWFETNLGQRLLEAETTALNPLLSSLFGYYLVQIGDVGNGCLLTSSRIVHGCVVTHNPQTEIIKPYSQIYAKLGALPLANECIDVILLPHVLEFESQPYAILKEIARVLIPGGHLIIIGFNLLSLWGVRRWFSRRCRILPWCGNFLSLLQLKEWFAVFDFNLETYSTCFFLPAVNQHKILNYMSFLDKLGSRVAWDFGAVFIVVARKQVAPLTPLKLKWHSTESSPALTIPKAF